MRTPRRKSAKNELGVFGLLAYDITTCSFVLSFHRTERGRLPSYYWIGGKQPVGQASMMIPLGPLFAIVERA